MQKAHPWHVTCGSQSTDPTPATEGAIFIKYLLHNPKAGHRFKGKEEVFRENDLHSVLQWKINVK